LKKVDERRLLIGKISSGFSEHLFKCDSLCINKTIKNK
jgi:hypothetical protein